MNRRLKRNTVIASLFLIIATVIYFFAQPSDETVASASGYVLENPVEIVYNSIDVYDKAEGSLRNIEPDMSPEDKSQFSEALIATKLEPQEGRPQGVTLYSSMSFTDNEGWMRAVAIFAKPDQKAYYINFIEDHKTYYRLTEDAMIEILQQKL